MIDALNSSLETLVASPWVLVVLFLACAVDAFFPVVPAEATVIAAGVMAAAGQESLAWIVVVVATGAFAGDQVSYLFGHLLGGHPVDWLLRNSRARTAHAAAERALRARGGLIIVALRFVPGGRTVTTLTAGIVGYPFARFAVLDAFAASLWAPYAALIGYWAGHLVADNHLLAVGVGIGISLGLTAFVETLRHLR